MIFIDSSSSFEINIDKVIFYIEKILDYLELSESDISVLFCDDDLIQELNYKYRNKNKVTDVLSFPQNEGVFSNFNKMLGDVVISLPQAYRQCFESEKTEFEEVIFLIIHSILHLTGYDHLNETDEKIMQHKEDEIFDFITEGKRI